ncbi:MAG: hypothetical protein AB1631_01190 [Acidobacteriota bacterium]
MKKHFLAASTLLVFVALCFAQGGPQKKAQSEGDAQRGITITIGLGRPSGNDCVSSKGFCIIISLRCASGDRKQKPEREVKGLARARGDQMAMELSSALPAGFNEITLDQDLALDDCTSRALGFSSLTVLKGRYSVGQGGKFGTIAVKTKGRPLS